MASLQKMAVMAAAAASLPLLASALYTNGSVIAPCDSPIYCHGDLLKQIELAQPFADSKTFVDMPAKKPLKDILAAFDKLEKPLSNSTALNDFLDEFFADAGGELKAVPKAELKTDAKFLDRVNDTVVKEFVEKVIEIWPDLTRSYVGASTDCADCPNSFLPVNRTFVVAGGRFREPYYWDSYWILEGLLRTGGSFVEISKHTIENFLDFVEQYGFVPNGARIYYLNRSQPPVLSQMVKIYVEHSNDTDILKRALPLLVKEHEFFMVNRTIDVKIEDTTYSLNRYAVQNTVPRPESFREDFNTATNSSYYAASGIIYPESRKLNETERAQLYANIATGAESGIDYTSRWISNPSDAVNDVYFPLRSLNNYNIVPVDLNAILYGNEVAIAHFYNLTGNETQAKTWTEAAAKRSDAMHAVFWNDTLFSYFDYNISSSAQNNFIPADKDAAVYDTRNAPEGQQVAFSIAQFYPFWMGSAPSHLKNNPYAVKNIFSRVESYLNARSGGIPATNLRTGQQWDQPNVWPPHMHILMKSLLNTPATFGEEDPDYKSLNKLALRLGQRYVDSTFCTWYATGGSTSETPRLAGQSDDAVGIMFEKYDDNSTNHAGRGGEYEVVEGFGWTNGVLMWTADTFGKQLKRPECGDIKAASTSPNKRGLSAVQLHARDAQRTKKFGSRALGHM